VDDLDLADHLAVQSLKYLRNRSISNPRWHDADYLKRFVDHGYLRWQIDGPLEAPRLAVEANLRAYVTAVARTNVHDEQCWTKVVDSVDRLIAAAEEIVGHRIRAKPW